MTHSTKNILYEVNVLAETSIRAEYMSWLKEHVLEILTLPGFVEASIWEDEAPEKGRFRVTIHYLIESREMMDRYLETDATRLREDAKRRFGDKFTASRRVLSKIDRLLRR